MKNLIFIFGLINFTCNSQDSMDTNKYNKLTPQEEYVIINKGTEAPFSGEYTNFKKEGVYKCKQCDAILFDSNDKFDSHCGWPSFDDAIEGRVMEVPDADGRRTEIICSNCKGHLGHVFKGEKFTEKDTRHCVNSISIKFVPKDSNINNDTLIKEETAIFAGGCFWGIEHHFLKKEGVISTDVGYTGGNLNNPKYEDVCNDNTGHAEAIKILFDPDLISYENLAKLFFEIHDPTQINRQGPDVGEQYRSEIFYTSEKQKEISLKLIDILKEKGFKVVTKITPAQKFWKAEEYHQEYYKKTQKKPYCHIYTKRF